MPLEGFRILDWASRTFGGLPSTLTGGFGVAVLLAGVIVAVIGFKSTPVSYSLIAAGVAMCVLTYFIVGSAISDVAHGTLQGGDRVAGAAPSVVPPAAATVLFGFALYAGRVALRFWSDEQASGKFVAVVLMLAMLGGVFVGVQVIRGSRGAPAPVAEHQDEPEAPVHDEPIRRGITTTRRR